MLHRVGAALEQTLVDALGAAHMRAEDGAQQLRERGDAACRVALEDALRPPARLWLSAGGGGGVGEGVAGTLTSCVHPELSCDRCQSVAIEKRYGFLPVISSSMERWYSSSHSPIDDGTVLTAGPSVAGFELACSTLQRPHHPTHHHPCSFFSRVRLSSPVAVAGRLVLQVCGVHGPACLAGHLVQRDAKAETTHLRWAVGAGDYGAGRRWAALGGGPWVGVGRAYDANAVGALERVECEDLWREGRGDGGGRLVRGGGG